MSTSQSGFPSPIRLLLRNRNLYTIAPVGGWLPILGSTRRWRLVDRFTSGSAIGVRGTLATVHSNGGAVNARSHLVARNERNHAHLHSSWSSHSSSCRITMCDVALPTCAASSLTRRANPARSPRPILHLLARPARMDARALHATKTPLATPPGVLDLCLVAHRSRSHSFFNCSGHYRSHFCRGSTLYADRERLGTRKRQISGGGGPSHGSETKCCGLS